MSCIRLSVKLAGFKKIVGTDPHRRTADVNDLQAEISLFFHWQMPLNGSIKGTNGSVQDA